MGWIKKYAELLGQYSLYLKKGELVYLRSTTLAHDLVSEFAKVCVDLGVKLEVELDYADKEEYLLANGPLELLEYIGKHKIELIRDCDAYLVIRAPYTKSNLFNVDPSNERIRSSALQTFQDIYFKRLGDGSLKRSLCQFPTEYAADMANMTFLEYQKFIQNACFLNADEPSKYWKEISARQQHYVDYLNNVEELVYENNDWRIKCNVKNRIWINSDGKSNMPSGEVFTSPIEDSVEGTIFFNYPTMIFGEVVEGIRLTVEKGVITRYKANIGQEVLDKVFAIDGTRVFGEVAIGTNTNITRATNNILFDEKIGGTVHMAIGQSYLQCGGKNKSSIHWDLITDMKSGGRIYADNKLIQENGEFLI
ncbi:MAG: aminopeptidase [Saprospiraceae bacterium]|nr:aminopeptidase [Saprospiraceae bacterium]